MEKEVFTANVIAVTLLILAVMLGLGIGIFRIMDNQATNVVENTMTEIRNKEDNSAFTKFDNTIVSGDDVMDCIQKYASYDAEYAVLISTQEYLSHKNDADINYLKQEDKRLKQVYGSDLTIKGKNLPVVRIEHNVWSKFQNKNMYAYAINYGALLGGQNKTVVGVETYYKKLDNIEYYPAYLSIDSNGRFICKSGVVGSTGNANINFSNTHIDNLNKVGAIEQVFPQGRYESFLIYNEYDEIVGLYFIEMDVSHQFE